jgi:ABC-type bacteriocin/lantibiotic exporter with double-glycine peptidase domain
LDLAVSVIIAGPYMIPLVVVYCYLGIALQQYNQKLLREVTRLQSITSSPISQAFSEIIMGGKTVRAFKAEEYVLKDYQNIIDENLKNYMMSNATKQMFQQRIQFLSFLIIVPSILLSVGSLKPRSS